MVLSIGVNMAKSDTFKLSEDAVDILKSQIQQSVDDAEDFLEEEIRPQIKENYDYYKEKIPTPEDGGPKYVDGTVSSVVEHATAMAMDAFTEDDTLEVVPESVQHPFQSKIINTVINDILNSENDRHTIYHTFFKDAFISGASLMKPYVTVNKKIDKEFFTEATAEQFAIRLAELEMDDSWEDVEYQITEEKEVELQQSGPVNDELGIISPEMVAEVSIKQKLMSGYFTKSKDEKTIKIQNIPAENFIINRDAKTIEDSQIVGHKAMVTISELLKMGFDYDKVLEAYEASGDDDAEDNMATLARKKTTDVDDESVDTSQREVELYELYMQSSVGETENKEDELAVSKLYQIFYVEGVILDCQEVEEIPYVGCSPFPMPHNFWGQGLADRVKNIQRGKTGNFRQFAEYNELVNKPKFMFQADQIEDPRSLFSPEAGAGISVKRMDAIAPIMLGGTLAGAQGEIDMLLDKQREAKTGITITGQSIAGEVLKAGASTASAQLLLSENQMMVKSMIKNMLNGGIKPLIKKIYNLLRDEFDEWETFIQGQVVPVNPNQMFPRLRDVVITTPLGSSAKLEKAMTIESLLTNLATSQDPEIKKLVSTEGVRNLVIEAYELRGLSGVNAYLATPQEVQQKDQMAQMMVQMQEMQAQLQQLTSQNTMLSTMANNIEERKIALEEKKVDMQGQQLADKQMLEEQKAETEAMKAADAQDLNERKYDLQERELDIKEQELD